MLCLSSYILDLAHLKEKQDLLCSPLLQSVCRVIMSFFNDISSAEEHDCEYTEHVMPRHKPDVPDPGRGPFSWLTSTWQFHDEALLSARGLDALMHLRTMRLMIIILSSYCLISLGMLNPRKS